MNRNEPDATKRRCGAIPFVNADGAFTAGITFATGLGEVLVSLDGAAPVAAANDITEIGRGFYWYQASQAETNCSRLIVILRKSGYVEQSFTQIMDGGGMVRDQGDASRRILTALPFYDLDGELLSGQTFLTASSEVLVSLNGAAWSPASTNAFPVEDGIYGYIASQSETNQGSFFAVLLAKATYVDRVYTQAVADTANEVSTPVITVISPTPNTTPGDVGGFPGNYVAARLVPIVVEITASGGLTFADAIVNGVLAYHGSVVIGGGLLVGDFIANSYQEVIPGGVRLHLLPSQGWPQAPIGATFDAVAGTAITASFTWLLPLDVSTNIVTAAILGARDVTDDALSRLVWQFTS